MLQRIDTEILTPRGRIVDICNIDMFDNNNNLKVILVLVSSNLLKFIQLISSFASSFTSVKRDCFRLRLNNQSQFLTSAPVVMIYKPYFPQLYKALKNDLSSERKENPAYNVKNFVLICKGYTEPVKVY